MEKVDKVESDAKSAWVTNSNYIIAIVKFTTDSVDLQYFGIEWNRPMRAPKHYIILLLVAIGQF